MLNFPSFFLKLSNFSPAQISVYNRSSTVANQIIQMISTIDIDNKRSFQPWKLYSSFKIFNASTNWSQIQRGRDLNSLNKVNVYVTWSSREAGEHRVSAGDMAAVFRNTCLYPVSTTLVSLRGSMPHLSPTEVTTFCFQEGDRSSLDRTRFSTQTQAIDQRMQGGTVESPTSHPLLMAGRSEASSSTVKTPKLASWLFSGPDWMRCIRQRTTRTLHSAIYLRL